MELINRGVRIKVREMGVGKEKGNIIAIGIIIFAVIFSIYHYISLGDAQIFINFFMLPFVWWLGKQYDETERSYEKLKNEKELLEENQMTITQWTKEYENLFDSLDAAIFSRDVTHAKVYFSKGFEKIFGYEDDAYCRNPHFWKDFILPAEMEKIIKNEQQLRLGHSTRIDFRINHPAFGERWIVKIAEPIRDADGAVVKINGLFIDVTERKQLEFQLKQLAYNDDLTGLSNRKGLDRHIGKALARSKRHNHNLTVMFIDLDDFKTVNDTFGHDAGDELLKEVVHRLEGCIREEDIIARIGGDEFIVVIEETNKEDIEVIAKRILDTVALPYTINEKDAKISLSIGISMYPDDGEDKDMLIDHADKAMYFAKYNGKNNYKLYTSDLSEIEFKKTGLLEKWINSIQKTKLFG